MKGRRLALFLCAVLLLLVGIFPRAVLENTDLEAEEIATKAINIAADIFIYTNKNITVESLD